MKAFIVILTFSLFSLISSEETANCSNFEPIDEFDLSRVAGKAWYVIFTYENGLESNISCSISNIKKSLDIDRYIFYDDGTEKIVSGKINIELMDESEPGILLSTWPPGYPSKKLVVYNDYKITMIVGCFKNEDFLWVFSLKKYPCKSVLRKIDDVIKELNLDRHQIYRKCTS